MNKSFELRRKGEGEQLLEPSFDPRFREDTSPRTSAAKRRGPGSSESDLAKALRILRKTWTTSVLFALAIICAVAAVTFMMKPVYMATARLEVDPPTSESPSLRDDAWGPSNPEFLETQTQLLKSEALAVDVIRDLRLNQNVEFIGKRALENPKNEPVNQVSSADQLSRLETVALKSLESNLNVTPIRSSHIIEVSFSSHNPALSAQVVNTLATQFVDRSYKARDTAIQRLSHELDDLRLKVQESNENLAALQNQNPLVETDDKQNTLTVKVLELSRQLGQAQADRIQIESYVKASEHGGADSMPQIRDNQLYQTLTQRFVESRTQLARALAVYGDNNANARKLQNEVDELEAQLKAERNRVLQALLTSYQSAKAREALLTSSLEGMNGDVRIMNQRTVQYNFLKKEAQVKEDLYDNLFAQLKQAGIAEGLRASGIRLVDYARILDEPTKPRKMLNILIGMVFGVLGGIALAFVTENFDDTIRSPDDIRKLTDRSPVGILPMVQPIKIIRGVSALPRSLLSERTSIQKFTVTQPHSAACEAVQNLLASIKLSRVSAPPRVILIVSPSPHEGKTTVAVNLAVTLARHSKTCLVDADLREPMIARLMGVPSVQGLSEVLNGSAELDAILRSVPAVTNLTIVPAGARPSSPGELVASDSMRKVVQKLVERFETVVIDSPPLIPYADARMLSRLADVVVLVGLCGSTKREAILLSVEILDEAHAPLLGIVLNGMDSRSPYYRYYREE